MSSATNVIAIDGPAGAGKSTTARRVADRMGYAFLDTGAMYRAATWWALHQGVDLEDGEALAASTEAMALDLRETDADLRVFVGGQDVSEAIRTPEVTRLIYKLDQNSAVRRHLVALQRKFGEEHPTVAEGRDIGTVVFPHAKCKIFLDASLDERTRRRAAQLEKGGAKVDLKHLREEIHERDEQSRNREDSPLRPAEDAIILDSSNLTLEAVVDEILRLAKEKL